ncbi:hypothetical protein JCM33374_g6579 [Metschnikowia sp. JCM 33374]|nr:hypothetical protein JCM33374_g6579 [Metschnikowia sp. JCM 33374]
MEFLIVSSDIVDEQQNVLACIRNLTDWITTPPAKHNNTNNTNNNRGRGRRFNQGRNSNRGRNFHYGQPTSNPNSQSVQGNRDYMNNTRLAHLGLFQGDDEQFGDESAPDSTANEEATKKRKLTKQKENIRREPHPRDTGINPGRDQIHNDKTGSVDKNPRKPAKGNDTETIDVVSEPALQLETIIQGRHTSLALLESGATADFIDGQFVRRLKLQEFPLQQRTRATLASADIHVEITSKVILDLECNGFTFYRGFHVYPHLVEDIVLGRPFLKKYADKLDFVGEEFNGRPPGSTNPEVFDLSEFRDVVRDDLPPGLPPTRDIQNSIEVIPEATPKARPPNRLSFEEKKELTLQIDQLLAEGKIEPCASPYGAPILFSLTSAWSSTSTTSLSSHTPRRNIGHTCIPYWKFFVSTSSWQSQKNLSSFRPNFTLQDTSFSPRGILPNADKIETIQALSNIATKKQAQSFLGLTRFYRRFIQNYAKNTSRIHDFIAGKESWSAHHDTLVETLKAKLTTAHILIQFILFTDHESLKAFKTQPTPTGRLGRWIAFFKEYDMDNRYIKGEKNVVADWLSRKNIDLRAVTLEICAPDATDMLVQLNYSRVDFSTNPVTFDRLQKEYKTDPVFAEPFDILVNNKPCPPKFKHILERYSVSQGLPYYSITSRDQPRLCIPQGSTRAMILHQAHDSNAAAQNSKTYSLVARQYYWKHQFQTCCRSVQQCRPCQRSKVDRQSRGGLLRPLDVPLESWPYIMMDFVGGFPVSAGCAHILVVVDRLTKIAHFIPCQK